MTTRRDALEALRVRLTTEIEAAQEPRDLPALSKELRAVWAELELLPVPGSKAPADEIARRRDDRRRQASRP